MNLRVTQVDKRRLGRLKDHTCRPCWLICASWRCQPLNSSLSPRFLPPLFLFIYWVYQFVTKMNNGWGCVLPRRHAKLVIVMRFTHSRAHAHTHKKRNCAMSPPCLTSVTSWSTGAHLFLCLMKRLKIMRRRGGVKHRNSLKDNSLIIRLPFHFSFFRSSCSESPGKAELVPTLHEDGENQPLSTKRPCEYSVDFSGAVQTWVMSKLLSVCPQDKDFNSLTFCGHARHKPNGGQRVGEIKGFVLWPSLGK